LIYAFAPKVNPAGMVGLDKKMLQDRIGIKQGLDERSAQTQKGSSGISRTALYERLLCEP
jgi:hypothetical protein